MKDDGLEWPFCSSSFLWREAPEKWPQWGRPTWEWRTAGVWVPRACVGCLSAAWSCAPQVAVALWAAPLMMRNCTLHRGGHWSRRRFKPQGSCNDTQCARGREKSPSGQAEAKAVVGLIGERIEGELPAAIDGVQCHVKHLSWRFLMLLFVSIGSLVPHASTGIVILCLG